MNDTSAIETEKLVDSQTADTPAETLSGASPESSITKRKKLPFYVVGGVLLVLTVAGLIYWIYTRQFEYTDDAFIDGEIIQISPKISAYVAKVLVKENQFVKKGDLLVELSAEDLEAKLEQAKSSLLAAQAQRTRALARTDLTRTTAYANQFQARSNVQTAKDKITETGLGAETKLSEIRQAETAVKIARANLTQERAQIPHAESNLRLAQLEYDRSNSLFKSGTVSRQSFEIADNNLQRAKASLCATRPTPPGATRCQLASWKEHRQRAARHRPG